MALSVRDHYRMLRLLLPPGQAFAFSDDSQLARLLRGLAVEYARVDETASSLIDEVLPDSTTHLIENWERIAGITAPTATIEERRRDVVARLTARGGQTVAYFLELAAAVGVELLLFEHSELIAGFSAGDYLTNGGWPYAFRVYRPDGQPVDKDLRSRLLQLRPSHTRIVFDDPWERDAA